MTDLVFFFNLKKSFQLFGSVVQIPVSISARRTGVILKDRSETHKRDKAKTFWRYACQPGGKPFPFNIP